MKNYVSFTRIVSGIADYNKESVFPDSVSFIRAFDYRSNPRSWTLLPKAQKESGTVVVDLPLWGERVSDTTYIYGDTGRIYSRSLTGSVSLLRSVSNSSGNGLKYFGEDGFLYYTLDKVIGRYGRIGSSPVFTDDFLGSEGGVPLNTHSLSLNGTTQYATAADSASLSITDDITLETYRKFNTLPSVGNMMALITKWNGSSNQRSYRFSVQSISGDFGDGATGTLTI